MKPSKACPLIVRGTGQDLSILAFEHPRSGRQLVKGTIERGESARETAVRELWEEAGVEAIALRDLGLWSSRHKRQVWSFHLCQATQPLPESWSHYCIDDGGHTFNFFWQPLAHELSDTWHPVHAAAIEFLRRSLLPARTASAS